MAAAYGLYTHIRANRVRSAFLLGGLFLLVYVMVFAGALIARAMTTDASTQWYLRQAFYDLLLASPFATAGTALWIWIAYRGHQWMVDAITGGRDVTRMEEPRLYNLLENLCISRGIPMPKLKIAETGAINAYATGVKPEQYAITVTTGLLNRLDDAETEAVLGHELTHIRNGDVRMMVIAVIVAGVIGLVAELVFRLLFQAGGSLRPSTWSSRRSSDSDKKGSGGAAIAIAIALALMALAWLLSIVIRFALSRSREYLADAGAVELTKNPDAMISALRKIEGRGELPHTPSAIMELCMDNPRSGFADLFATHPAMDKRVDALVRMAGGHDPGPIALADWSADDPRGGLPAPEEPQAFSAEADKPFLPAQPPLVIGAPHGPWNTPPRPAGPREG
jgi:heat shock protein HtpX